MTRDERDKVAILERALAEERQARLDAEHRQRIAEGLARARLEALLDAGAEVQRLRRGAAQGGCPTGACGEVGSGAICTGCRIDAEIEKAGGLRV